VNDLTVFKQAWSTKVNRCFFDDKIYQNKEFFAEFEKDKKSVMVTPIKAVKGERKEIINRDKASNDLYSKAILWTRQPIESFFNWLIQKTDTQKASKVRYSKELLVHIFGKIVVAFIYLIF
jgi:uncharacterized protein YycO